MMCVLFRRRENAQQFIIFLPFNDCLLLRWAFTSLGLKMRRFFFQFHFSSSLLLTCHTLSMNEFGLTILGLCARLVYTLPYSSSCAARLYMRDYKSFCSVIIFFFFAEWLLVLSLHFRCHKDSPEMKNIWWTWKWRQFLWRRLSFTSSTLDCITGVNYRKNTSRKKIIFHPKNLFPTSLC